MTMNSPEYVPPVPQKAPENRGVAPVRNESGKMPELKTANEWLQFAAKRHSLPFLGRIALGGENLSKEKSFDFEKKAADLEAAKAKGELFTTADKSMNDAWVASRNENSLPVSEWAKQVIQRTFSTNT